MEEDVAELRIEDIVEEEESSGTRKDRRLRSPDTANEGESKKMRIESGDKPLHSNGEAGKRKREAEIIPAESERNLSRKDPRRRNRSRSRSPHRRNSRSPRRRSRSKSPSREHKRGDPRANAARNRQICYDYSRGRCNKGASCKYIHEEPPEERGGWSKDDPANESLNPKPRTPRSLNPRDPRDSSKERETRDPRDPRNVKEQPRDPRDRPRDPREKASKRDENNRHDSAPGDYPEPNQAPVPAQQQQQQQPDWTNLQPMNKWQQSLAPFSITASLQALQEQNFKVPPPPPPLPPSGVPPGFTVLSVDPRVSAVSSVTEPDQSHAQANEIPEAEKSPAESDENQNGEADNEDAEVEPKHKSKKDVKAAMPVRLAVTEYVKEVLKPTWKEGNMSKDVYKTIAKKAVDKVVGTLSSHQIPRTADKVGHFMEFSRPKISKLVQGYVEKYSK